MFRLTREGPGHEVLRIDGGLEADAVEDLRRLLAEERGAARTLDLDGLTSLDGAGRSLLLRLRAEGYRLRGGSLYVRQVLEEAQL